MQDFSHEGLEEVEQKFNPSRYPVVEVNIKLPAAVYKIWQAWSEPELMKQWWGPEGFSCPEARMDFREGGHYTLAMADPQGKVTWGSGEFRELVPNEKIILTDHFSDEHGKAIDPKSVGMPGLWPANTFIHVEFEKTGDQQTTVHLRHEGIPAEMHDSCVQGWTSSLQKLRRLVQAN